MIGDAVLALACKGRFYSDKFVIYLGVTIARKDKVKSY